MEQLILQTQGVNILVVDDSQPNLLIAKNVMERYGICVMTASGGKEALEYVREKEFDYWTNNAGAISNPNTAVTSFTMPAAPAEVTAVFRDIIVETFTLTVNGGSGTGSYAAQTVIPLTAAEPEKGMEFSHWDNDAGAVANANNSSTSFTMPATNAVVTACYQQVNYRLTVTNGTEASSFSGTYHYNDVIELVADEPAEGMVFSHWENNAGAIANANQSSTTFTMPAKDAQVVACYKAVEATE